MNAVGYIRVSTDEQASNGDSLQSQRARIEAWALANEAELVAVYVDAGVSGKRADNRPELQRAIDHATETGAALVVYSLSRLARSTRDTIELAERLGKAGADLVSLSERIDTTTAAGKMVFRMLAVLAEFERDLVSERTAAVLAHKKAGRQAYARTPFGFDRSGNELVPNRAEGEAVRMMQQLRSRGSSLRNIAGEMERLGIATKRGGSWNAVTVSKILNNSIHDPGRDNTPEPVSSCPAFIPHL